VLTGKNILLGITGSIAAYKSVDVARRLVECGAGVNVVMTEAACRFIPPYTLETVTGNPVHTDLFINPFSHINLSKEADLLIIAPVTANTINKISCGLADDLLSNIWLTYEGPVLMAPAMNYRMYRNAIVQKNIKGLQGSDVKFIGPEKGSLACGEEGAGRMADVPEIIEAAVSALTPKDLRKHNILVTAGPTIEPIDPVRFISNRSSGKMGYAVAKAAERRGANVTLVSGPSSLKPPAGANFVPVEKASEMETAVLKYFPKATSVIMAAAVSDFTPSLKSKVKLKKDDINTLKLKRNNDILKKLGKKKAGKTLIGFAAETGNGVKKAEKKLKEKNLDMIVMNNVLQDGAGFDSDTNIITIIDKKGKIEKHPKMKKIEAANIILDKMLKLKKR
jgi:phosphopantothenoylcysteine decarboxylase/phosphopantothenate--cysteine ligase